jgi:hypothetical protein
MIMKKQQFMHFLMLVLADMLDICKKATQLLFYKYNLDTVVFLNRHFHTFNVDWFVVLMVLIVCVNTG